MIDKKEIKTQLNDLITEGRGVFYVLSFEYDKEYSKDKRGAAQNFLNGVAKKMEAPSKDYQVWYDKAYRMVRTFSPERLEEFEKLYTGDKSVKNSEYLDSITIGILHYFKGITKTAGIKQDDFFETALTCLAVQISILMAIKENFDNNLFNMESNIHYGIYESEMEIAEELQKQERFRVAGAIAGVILEVHLKNVVTNRGIPINSQKPGILDYNNILRSKNVYDKITAGLIKSCNDIRNKCVHPNKGEPTESDVSHIISTAERIIGEVK